MREELEEVLRESRPYHIGPWWPADIQDAESEIVKLSAEVQSIKDQIDNLPNRSNNWRSRAGHALDGKAAAISWLKTWIKAEADEIDLAAILKPMAKVGVDEAALKSLRNRQDNLEKQAATSAKWKALADQRGAVIKKLQMTISANRIAAASAPDPIKFYNAIIDSNEKRILRHETQIKLKDLYKILAALPAEHGAPAIAALVQADPFIPAVNVDKARANIEKAKAAIARARSAIDDFKAQVERPEVSP